MIVQVGQAAAASPSALSETPRAEIAARAREAMQKRQEGTPTSRALALGLGLGAGGEDSPSWRCLENEENESAEKHVDGN